MLTNQEYRFGYDTKDRLTNWDIYQNGSQTQVNSQGYDDAGNIQYRTDLDSLMMSYGVNGKPHALASIAGTTSAIPLDSLTITYTDFRKIATLNEGDKAYELTYGVDNQRRKSIQKVNGTTQLTRYYLGDYEEEITPAGNIRKIHYLSGGAILIRNNGVDTLLYAYSDNQGSLTALTNETGTVLERYAYDPWGRRLNPSDWKTADTRTSWRTNRGYTGHEHLDAFGIINMNGRVYDHATAMFLSPDPFVQEPGNWGNYNRYGYCLNNPTNFTDPSGYEYWSDTFSMTEEGRSFLNAFGETTLAFSRSGGGGGGLGGWNGNGVGSNGVHWDWDDGRWEDSNNNVVYGSQVHEYIYLNAFISVTFDENGHRQTYLSDEAQKLLQEGYTAGNSNWAGLPSGIALLFKLAYKYAYGINNGQNPLEIDISDWDLNTTQKELQITKKEQWVDLFNSGFNAYSLGFGSVYMTNKGNDRFEIAKNTFDFNYMESGSLKRNTLTFIGGALFGDFFTFFSFSPTRANNIQNGIGGPFTVIFVGTVYIPK